MSKAQKGKAAKKGADKGEEVVEKLENYGPKGMQVGEHNFGVCHIFATFNNTFIHVTDLSGRETYARITGNIYIIN